MIMRHLSEQFLFSITVWEYKVNFFTLALEGSGGGKVVRAMDSYSRGPEFKSTWRRGFFLFFYQQHSVLNQVPQERCISAVFP